MKKIMLLVLALFLFAMIGCSQESNNPNEVDKEKILAEAMEQISVPSECSSDITLIDKLVYENYEINLEWTSNNEAINSQGKVSCGDSDISCTLKVKGSLDGFTKEKEFTVLVKGEAIDLLAALNTLSVDELIDSDITLNSNITFSGRSIPITWSVEVLQSDGRGNIDNTGKVTLPLEEDASFIIYASASLNGKTEEKGFAVTVKSIKTLCIEASKKVSLPKSINDDIELPTKIDNVDVEWYTSNSEVLTKTGKCSYVTSEQSIKLSAAFSIDYEVDNEIETYYYDADYRIKVLPYSFEKRVSLIEDTIKFNGRLYGKVTLPTSFDYDLSGSWVSANKDVIKDDGTIITPNEDQLVKLELTIKDNLDESNEAKLSFEVLVPTCLDNEDELEFFYHNIIDYTSLYSASHLKNLKFNDQGKVVLEDSALSGTYESRVFYTHKFKSLVGSWSCITSPDATIELEISVFTGGKWSNYFTYGVWGLGKTNTYYNQSDSNTNTKMSVDEIIINNGDATACKYRVTLKRNNTTTSSPVLSLVCLTLDISESDYSYPVDVSNLPKSVDNNIPKLYQYDVPGIGGSICSATTTTMLLKWKGYSFTDKGKTYEHEYIAGLVADPGHNSPTYGNWSYNMAVAGAYGDNAYVARMYSWEEVMYHLATVGPMGASIRSSNGEWGYTTNGHLVIIRGYRISDSGAVTVICNDPAVKNVYYEVTLNQFLQCWRGVAYVMEK